MQGIDLVTLISQNYIYSILILMQVDEVCLYNYAVDQQFGSYGLTEQNLSFSATVEIGCHSGITVIV